MAGAGEQQVVEFELGKLHAHTAGFIEKRQLFWREISGHFFHQKPGQMARVFRHLHHCPVARSEDVNQWNKAQVDGKVPRYDTAHHAQRLGNNAIFGPKKVTKIYAPFLGFHPLFEVFEGVVHRINGRKYFCEKRFVRGAVAVVCIDRRDQSVFVLTNERLEFVQVSPALVQRGHGVGEVGGALQLQRFFKRAVLNGGAHVW